MDPSSCSAWKSMQQDRKGPAKASEPSAGSASKSSRQDLAGLTAVWVCRSRSSGGDGGSRPLRASAPTSTSDLDATGYTGPLMPLAATSTQAAATSPGSTPTSGARRWWLQGMPDFGFLDKNFNIVWSNNPRGQLSAWLFQHLLDVTGSTDPSATNAQPCGAIRNSGASTIGSPSRSSRAEIMGESGAREGRPTWTKKRRPTWTKKRRRTLWEPSS